MTKSNIFPARLNPISVLEAKRPDCICWPVVKAFKLFKMSFLGANLGFIQSPSLSLPLSIWICREQWYETDLKTLHVEKQAQSVNDHSSSSSQRFGAARTKSLPTDTPEINTGRKRWAWPADAWTSSCVGVWTLFTCWETEVEVLKGRRPGYLLQHHVIQIWITFGKQEV